MYTSKEHIKLKLDDFLNFIHKYLEDNFSDSVKTFDITLHIKNNTRKEEMRQLLVLEDIWVIRIQNLQLERDNNKEFQWYLENYRLYENNGIFTYLTKTSFFNRLRSKLWFPERIWVKDFKRIRNNTKKKPYIKTDSFSSMAIYRDWEDFKSKIPNFTVFTARVQIVPLFFYESLHTLIYREEEDSISRIVTELYENISSEIWEKRNSDNEVVVFYPLRDYIDNKSSIYPILYELEQKWILRISKQEIKGWKIYFTLTDINNFTLEECKKSYHLIKREVTDIADFKNDVLYINHEAVSFRWKNTKIFMVIKILFEILQENKNIEISYVEFSEYYQEKEYTWLGNMKYDIDDFWKIIKNFNKRIHEKYKIEEFIGLNNNWLLCKYFKSEKT